MDVDRGLRAKAAAEFFGIKESTLWLWAKRPDFPPRIKLSPRVTIWRQADLVRWRDAQSANSATDRKAA